MANYVKGKPNAIIDILAPMTTRQKWDAWFKNSFKGDDPAYYNRMIAEIESELPFENEEEHKKWYDMGSTWMGDYEYPDLTNKILKRIDDYDLDSENTKKLKKYKGKDYDEAMRRYLGGEPVNDILNGLVTYEKY